MISRSPGLGRIGCGMCQQDRQEVKPPQREVLHKAGNRHISIKLRVQREDKRAPASSTSAELNPIGREHHANQLRIQPGKQNLCKRRRSLASSISPGSQVQSARGEVASQAPPASAKKCLRHTSIMNASSLRPHPQARPQKEITIWRLQHKRPRRGAPSASPNKFAGH